MEELKLIITIVIAGTAIVGALVGGVRWQVGQQQAIAKRIEDATDRKIAAITSEIANLHGRINDVRDQYVRRDDMMAHIGRIEDGLKAINGRLDILFRPTAQSVREGR